jgi:hypothetical protein
LKLLTPLFYYLIHLQSQWYQTPPPLITSQITTLLWKEGHYREKLSRKTFNFKYIIGLSYFLRSYITDLDLGVIGGTRPFTTKKCALVREERQRIQEKYRKP